MLKNLARLEHVIGERAYHLFCDQSSPIHEIKEALCEFLKFVGNIEDQVKQQQASTQTESVPDIEPLEKVE